MKNIAICLLLVILTSSTALSQQHVGDGDLSEINLNFQSPPSNLVTEISSAKLYVKFYLNDKAYEQHQLNNDGLDLIFNLSVIDGTKVLASEDNLMLNINDKQPENWMVYDMANIVSQEQSFNHIVTVSPQSIDRHGNVTTAFNNDIVMDAFITIDYKTGVALNGDVMEVLSIDPVQLSQNNNRLATFNWTANNPYPAFQLQLVKLYNVNSLKQGEEEIEAEVDWAKALTLEVYNDGNTIGNKSIGLSIIEGTGYYAWRVRPLGNLGKGLTSDKRNLGAWSDCETTLNIDAADQVTANSFFYFTDPEADKNWSYTRVFSEKGKQKDIIQFANGLNYVQQTQTHLYSSDITLITQSVVDYSGRASINTMPVPVSEQNLSTYKTDFFRTESNQLYTAKDFDTDNNYLNPAKNSQNNSFSYYNGATGRVPNAQQYAFSRVLYYNDGTGRVKEQTGVGETHHLSANGGKTTRFYYTSPTDAELITLFGSEAPSTSSVLKVTTVDPNGIASVQYKTKDGKLLATAIQEKNTANPVMDELNSPENILDGQIMENKLSLTTMEGFVTSKRFVLTSHTSDLKVKYTPPTSAFWDGVNFGTCIDGNCSYDLKIQIFDLNTSATDQLVWSHESQVDKNTAEFEEIVDVGGVAGAGLSDGEYIIVKSLTPSAGDANMGEKSADNMVVLVQPVINLIKYWLKQVDNVEGVELEHVYADIQDIPNSIDPSTSETNPEKKIFQDLIDANVINWPPDIDFKNSLMLGDININTDSDGDPYELVINTCDDPLIVPLKPPVPAYNCDASLIDDESQYVVEDYDPLDEQKGVFDFEGYMLQKLAGLIATIGENQFYTDYMPGYQKGDFNRMVYHMLNDQYAEVNGDHPDVITSQVKAQYTCQQLWPQWAAAVQLVLDLNQAGTSYRVDHNVDDKNGEPAGSGSTQNDHFNSNFKPPFGGRLLRWAFKLILSKRMRNFSGGNHVTAQIKKDLPYMFLQSVGFKFARVNDTWDELGDNYHVLPEDQEEYDQYTLGREFSENMAKIYCPVFAFKYFEYFSKRVEHQWFRFQFSRYYGCESCERAFNYGLEELPEQDDCTSNIETQKLFAAWNFADRLAFYECIQLCPEMPTPEDESTQNCASTYPPEVIRQMIVDFNTQCEAAIAYRETEFFNELQAMAIENGYALWGCENEENVITREFLQEMAQAMVTQLQEKTCSLDENGGTCQDFVCDPAYMIIDLNATEPGKIDEMYKIMYGEIEFNLNKAPGNTPPAPECDATVDHTLRIENGVIQP